MSRQQPTTYVRVDLSALTHNYREIAGYLEGRAALMPVVKANAYGHGLVEVARHFVSLGCAELGVASVEEGLRLREGGVTVPVLVFQPPTQEELAAAVARELTVTLTQPEHVEALATLPAARSCRYEIGVDVGLGRSGYLGDPAEFLRRAESRLGVRAVGVWTHIGPAMVPEALPTEAPVTWESARSVAARLRYLEALRQRLDDPRPLFHAAASAALADTDSLLWDRVRVGSLLYGVYPVHAARRPFRLRGALELRTRIIELRTLPAGAAVGYGGEFRPRRPTRLATLPVGFTHGVAVVPESTLSLPAAAKRSLSALLGRRGRTFRPTLVTIAGARAPIVGRVSLNECTVDVTDVPAAKLGDEVVVPARMTTLSPTIPRVYVEGNG